MTLHIIQDSSIFLSSTKINLGGKELRNIKKTLKKLLRKSSPKPRKSSTTEQHRSTITDHFAQENHLIDWAETKIIDRGSNLFTRKVREAIQIRKRATKALNRDDGLLSLSRSRI